MSEKVREETIRWLVTITVTLAVALLVRGYVVAPTIVQGTSMLPTFETSDRVIISKLSHIDRFDVIVFDAPDSDRQYIKRVIGLPGDKVDMVNDILYINGEPCTESYLDRNLKAPKRELFTRDFSLNDLTGVETIPDNYYFVLGDNRQNSIDSRYFGLISSKSIVGEVKFTYYSKPVTSITKP